MKPVCIAGLLLFLSACSPQAVRCDGALRPINAPAPRTTARPPVPAQQKSPATAQKGLRP